MNKSAAVKTLYDVMNECRKREIKSLEELKCHYALHERYGAACMNVVKALFPYDNELEEALRESMENIYADVTILAYLNFKKWFISLEGYPYIGQFFRYLNAYCHKRYADKWRKVKYDFEDYNPDVDDEDMERETVEEWLCRIAYRKCASSKENPLVDEILMGNMHDLFLNYMRNMDKDYLVFYFAEITGYSIVELERLCSGNFDLAIEMMLEDLKYSNLMLEEEYMEQILSGKCRCHSAKTLSKKHKAYLNFMYDVVKENGLIENDFLRR